MFSPSRLVIDAFAADVVARFRAAFPDDSERYARVLGQAAEMALEALAGTDGPYHDIEHTIQVTDVGQTILRGRMLCQGDVSAHDWVHFVIATLHHDIGFIRGLLSGDRPGRYLINQDGDTVTPPPGATDAFLAPYHIERGRMFIAERFATEPAVDVEVLCQHVEMTRFPVPDDAFYTRVADFSGLVRAADLIGQLADPNYIRKLSKLYAEFCETGDSDRWGYDDAGALRANYPAFFFGYVRPYISEGLRYLRKTQEGQQWTANLFHHVHCEQYGEPSSGPEPGAERGSANAPGNAVAIGPR